MLSMMAMAAIVYLNNTGAITYQDMLIYSTVMSLVMFAIIIIYMVYSMRARPKLIEYKQLRDAAKEEEEPPQKD